MRNAVHAAAFLMMAGAAAAAEPRLVIVLAFQERISEDTLVAMRGEVEHIFATTRADMDLLVLEGTLEVRRADQIIHIDVAGMCAGKARNRPIVNTTLAAMFGVDRKLQPIGRLDCEALADYLGRVPPMIFGRALGRVLAHELYHYLTQRRDHSPRGLFASGLSDLALTGPDLHFTQQDVDKLNAKLDSLTAGGSIDAGM